MRDGKCLIKKDLHFNFLRFLNKISDDFSQCKVTGNHALFSILQLPHADRNSIQLYLWNKNTE